MSDTIYSTPGATFYSELNNAPTGLGGTIGVRILAKSDDSEVTPRTTAGIVEAPAGSGRYKATLIAPSAAEYTVFWDTGGELTPSNTASDDLVVTANPVTLVLGAMVAPSSADIRRWSQLVFAEYGQGEDPFEGAPDETTLDTAVTFPDGEFDVVDASALPANGEVLLQVGAQWRVVKYTSISGDTLKGVVTIASNAGLASAQRFDAGARVQEYKTDPLDEHRDRAVADFLNLTGQTFTTVPAEKIPLVRQAVQMLTEYKCVSGDEGTVETAGDFDLIGSMSAGSYSETRRADNRRSLVLHPWPALNKLLWQLVTADQLAAMGLADAPEVSELEDPADWRVAENVMRIPFAGIDPAFGTVSPPWF